MNMDFQKQQAFELRFPRYELAAAESHRSSQLSWSSRFLMLLFPLAALSLSYGLTAANASMWIIAGVCIGLVAIAAAVRTYGLNNHW